jgi:CBS domain-containing protein
MLIKEIMSRNVVTISSNKSVYDASILYRDFKIGCLIVLENDKCAGIITERDIIERTICEKKNPKNTKVCDIMSRDVKTIHPLDTIEKALEKMIEKNIKKLLVCLNDEIIGVITSTDIVKSRPDVSKRVINSWIKPIWDD